MPMISVPAHFDGKRICMDEPFELEPNAKLIVTILSGQKSMNEHEAWLQLSGQRLAGVSEKGHSSGVMILFINQLE